MPTPTITPLPPAPQRSDLPGIFRAKSDAFVAALVVFASQVAAVIVWMAEMVAAVVADRVQTGQDRVSAALSAGAAAASALTAVQAPGTIASTIATLTPGLGLQAFQIQQNKLLIPGHNVSIGLQANGSRRMVGPVKSYDPATGNIVVDVEAFFGAATPATGWSIGLSPPGAIPIASKEEIWAGTDNGKAITAAGEAAADEFQTVAYASTLALNFATQGRHLKVVLAGNPTIPVPSGMRDGRYYAIMLGTGAGGVRTWVMPGIFDWGPAGVPVPSTVAGKFDTVRLQCIDAATGACKATFVKAG